METELQLLLRKFRTPRTSKNSANALLHEVQALRIGTEQRHMPWTFSHQTPPSHHHRRSVTGVTSSAIIAQHRTTIKMRAHPLAWWIDVDAVDGIFMGKNPNSCDEGDDLFSFVTPPSLDGRTGGTPTSRECSTGLVPNPLFYGVFFHGIP